MKIGNSGRRAGPWLPPLAPASLWLPSAACGASGCSAGACGCEGCAWCTSGLAMYWLPPVSPGDMSSAQPCGMKESML